MSGMESPFPFLRWVGHAFWLLFWGTLICIAPMWWRVPFLVGFGGSVGLLTLAIVGRWLPEAE